MVEPLQAILIAVFGYLLGSIPSAYLAGRLVARIDIRTVGTRNACALNTFRQVGAGAAIAVLVADVLKGSLSIIIAMWVGESPWVCFYAAIAVVAGHNRPIFLGFRGGKGVAATLGVSLAVVPWLTLLALVPATLALLLSRNVVFATSVGFVFVNSLVVATRQEWAQVLLCMLLTTGVIATYIGRSWHQPVYSVRRGRLPDLFSFE